MALRAIRNPIIITLLIYVIIIYLYMYIYVSIHEQNVYINHKLGRRKTIGTVVVHVSTDLFPLN